MRKVLLILLLVVFVTSLPAAKAYLLPSDGRPSKIVSLSRDVDVKASKGVLSWLEYTDGGDPNFVLTGVADVDTFMNWFAPAAACSLLAYEVTNMNNYTGAGSDNFIMFFATLDQGINYATAYDEYHGASASPGPPPIVSIVQATPATVLFADTLWTVTTDTLTTPIDNGLDVFGAGWVKPAAPESTPNPYIYGNGSAPYHALMYREVGGVKGWYSSWHCVRVRALVNFYANPPPNAYPERLPDSYTTGARTVNIAADDFGVPEDSSGTETCVIEYQVNGGSVNQVFTTMIPGSGDSTDGLWNGDIPGVSAGDTVDYWVVTTDYQGAAATSLVYSYIIEQGDPGDFLFVDNGYTYGVIPDFYGLVDTVDVWYGYPDASVIAFYNTVVIRDWGGTYLGAGVDFGAGILHSDSAAIKDLLDRGGNFWLSDQDQGYSFGICPDYGQQDVPASSWVQQYLGIQGMYDDPPLLGATAFNAYGDPADPVIGDLFTGIGLQAAGMVYIAPYYHLTGGFSYAYTGCYDSLQVGAVQNMYDINGLVVSYRYEGPGGSDYKVYNDFFPWDYICDPADADVLDFVTVDSLVDDVMKWFGYPASGIEEIEPERMVSLLPVGLVSGEAMLKFSLPERMVVSLDVFDISGRLLKNLVNGEVDAGVHAFRWNAKVAGIYFYRLTARDKTITDKMVVIR